MTPRELDLRTLECAQVESRITLSHWMPTCLLHDLKTPGMIAGRHMLVGINCFRAFSSWLTNFYIWSMPNLRTADGAERTFRASQVD